MRFSMDQFAIGEVANAKTGGAAIISGSVAWFIQTMYNAEIGDMRYYVALAFLIIIALDWLTGIAASFKDGTLSSEYGINGILRTIFVICFPALARFLDNALGTTEVLFYGVTGGLMFHYWQSVTANAYRAGWDKWIPKWLMNLVASEIESKIARATKRKGENP
ncbi:phage holin family protein [Brevibacillus migulae]|uniref:phage holin family protein n=1 Tax=Brevibacillus migulae TaxID=1644114 RepID=UPI00106DFE23|nr:phage holin family protein [Brevibacillus migulae]